MNSTPTATSSKPVPQRKSRVDGDHGKEGLAWRQTVERGPRRFTNLARDCPTDEDAKTVLPKSGPTFWALVELTRKVVDDEAGPVSDPCQDSTRRPAGDVTEGPSTSRPTRRATAGGPSASKSPKTKESARKNDPAALRRKQSEEAKKRPLDFSSRGEPSPAKRERGRPPGTTNEKASETSTPLESEPGDDPRTTVGTAARANDDDDDFEAFSTTKFCKTEPQARSTRRRQSKHPTDRRRCQVDRFQDRTRAKRSPSQRRTRRARAADGTGRSRQLRRRRRRKAKGNGFRHRLE